MPAAPLKVNVGDLVVHAISAGGRAVEQGGGHFRIAKDTRPFAEARLVVTMIDVRSERLLIRWNSSCIPACAKGSRVVENVEVEACEIVGEPHLAGGAPLGLGLTRSTGANRLRVIVIPLPVPPTRTTLRC
jgi:hypothetical protein